MSTTKLKYTKATNVRPEKVSDGKFVTATTGRVRLGATTEQFKGDKYEHDVAKVYTASRETVKHFTTSMSYCHHTGTKLVVGTSFSNCPELTTLVKSAHPIFAPELPLATAMKIYGKSRTPTERYISMVAVLVKARIIDTSFCGLHLDTEQCDHVRQVFETLLAVLNQAITIKYTAAIDMLLINPDIASDAKRLHTHIKEVAQAIDNATFASGGKKLLILDDRTSKQLVLDDEIELEKELNKILSGYGKSKGNSYTSILNSWTRRALKRSDMTDEQVEMTMKILNTAPDKIRTGTIEAILKTVEASLCYDDEISRRNSALVLRHLHYKIELQMACLYKSGFVSDVIAEEVRSDKAMTTYITASKVEEDTAIKAISRTTSPALARMRQKLGLK